MKKMSIFVKGTVYDFAICGMKELRKLALVLVVALLLGGFVIGNEPVRASEPGKQDIRVGAFATDLLKNKKYPKQDFYGSVSVMGYDSQYFDVEFDFMDCFAAVKAGLDGIEPYFMFVEAGTFNVTVKVRVKDFLNKLGIRGMWSKTFKVIVAEDEKQAKIDDFLREVYYANHEGATEFDPDDIGYLNVSLDKEGCECLHWKGGNGNGCSNCSICSLLTDSWMSRCEKFKLMVDTYRNEKTRSKLAGSSGKSCFLVHLIADYVHRTSVNDDVTSKNDRRYGTLNKAFLEKLRPSEVIYIKSGGKVVHYCMLYSFQADGSVTMIDINLKNPKGHCYVTKTTYSLDGEGYPKYPYAGCKVEARRYRVA